MENNLKNAIPKPFVFVLMPFNKEFNDIYEFGIKQACLDTGFYCERVDEQHFDGSILERIYNQISKADLIISDMSTQNPNVFYETGYAHALGKKVILLTQDTKFIPFDMIHYPHIVYNNQIKKLNSDLKTKLLWIKENPQPVNENMFLPIDYFYGKQLLSGHLMTSEYLSVLPGVQLNITMYNGGNRIIMPEDIKIAINTSQRFPIGNYNMDGLFLPDNTVNHYVPAIEKLFPNAWYSFGIYLTFDSHERDSIPEDYRESMKLIEYSGYGKREISFEVAFVNKILNFEF